MYVSIYLVYLSIYIYVYLTINLSINLSIIYISIYHLSIYLSAGEQISALIAGYIDIILKRRQRKERFGEDGNEEEVLEESFISPGRAIEIHGLPANLKKAKTDSLAKPGLLRNSGGTLNISCFKSFYAFLLLLFSL